MAFVEVARRLKRAANGRIQARGRRITWLDTVPPHCVLAEAEQVSAYAPRVVAPVAPTEVTAPAVTAHLLREVTVSMRSAAFLTRRRLFVERPEGFDRGRYQLGGGILSVHEGDRALLNEHPVSTIDRGIFLGGYGYFNYYHWLVELLPKLHYRSRLDGELSSWPLLVGTAVRDNPNLLEALRLWAGEAEIQFLDESRHYAVGELVHLSSPNSLPFNLRDGAELRVDDVCIRPSTVVSWRERLGLGDGTQIVPGKKLFLARSSPRRGYNDSEVKAHLEDRGFRSVYLEQFTFAEQVALVADAEIIAGPTGAAWTNIMFAAPGAKGLCWMAEGASTFAAYSTLAALVSVDLRFLLYPSPTTSTGVLFEEPYVLDVRELLRALDTLSPEKAT